MVSPAWPFPLVLVGDEVGLVEDEASPVPAPIALILGTSLPDPLVAHLFGRACCISAKR